MGNFLVHPWPSKQTYASSAPALSATWKGRRRFTQALLFSDPFPSVSSLLLIFTSPLPVHLPFWSPLIHPAKKPLFGVFGLATQ